MAEECGEGGSSQGIRKQTGRSLHLPHMICARATPQCHLLQHTHPPPVPLSPWVRVDSLVGFRLPHPVSSSDLLVLSDTWALGGPSHPHPHLTTSMSVSLPDLST